MPHTPTVTIRAALTPREYAKLRSIGFEKGARVSDLVAAALRATYPLTPKETTEP